jgi:beta-lactamase regulating signal transducer with metallopeptidase domain
MLGSSLAGNALAWAACLVVYLVHASIWVAIAALLSRWATHRVATQHTLWKLALLGPLLTTGVAMVVPQGLGAGLGATLLQARLTTQEPSEAAPLRVATRLLAGPASHDDAWLSWTLCGGTEADLLMLLVLTVCAVGLIRVGAAVRLLRHALRGRSEVRDPRLRGRFEQLCARAAKPPIRLTESRHAPGPMVVGRREVCLPTGLLSAFSDAEVEAVLAHELAHLERRDGLWFLVIGLLEALLWLQPLNHWVAVRFRQSAELACDDRAIELTQAPLALARALTRIAESGLHASRGRMLPGIAGSTSTALLRVRRLVAAAGHHETAPLFAKPRGGWPVLCLAALGMLLGNVRAVVVAPDMVRASTLRGRAAAHIVQPELAQQSVLAQQTEMHALAEQAWALERAIADLHARPEGYAPDAPELLELTQTLRHVRATQVFTERRFEAAAAH